MKDKSIKVTSLKGHREENFPLNFKDDLIQKIDEYKLIFQKPSFNWYEGRRYNDNKRIANVIMGELDLIHKKEKNYITKLNDQKLNLWIKEALIYSGESDYWYMYEKEW